MTSTSCGGHTRIQSSLNIAENQEKIIELGGTQLLSWLGNTQFSPKNFCPMRCGLMLLYGECIDRPMNKGAFIDHNQFNFVDPKPMMLLVILSKTIITSHFPWTLCNRETLSITYNNTKSSFLSSS